MGTDFAGLGGDVHFVRAQHQRGVLHSARPVYRQQRLGLQARRRCGLPVATADKQEQIIDRFFLGGDNLRGFEIGGAGPHDAISGDPLGGRFIWTGTSELRYPLPVSPDLGLSGRAFVDVGGADRCQLHPALRRTLRQRLMPARPARSRRHGTPRVGAGVGISWRSSFGLINIDLAPFVIKQPGDQTQIFRFGFGTRF